MSDAVLTKLDWIPLYIQRLKGSEAWGMPDYQFCWYFKLLIESVDSPLPGYLPGSTDKLWRLAGAKSQSYFEKWGGCELVSRLFCRTEIEGQAWIYNQRMLQVIHEQNGKLTTKKRKRCVSLSLSVQEVPEWVPEESWKGFMEMREKKKKPLTGRAIKILIRELDELRAQGHDPGKVIDLATKKDWLSFYGDTSTLSGRTNGTSAHSSRPGSLAEESCPTCGGSGWDRTSGKAARCACFIKNRAERAASGA